MPANKLFSGTAVRWGSYHFAIGDPAIHQVENDLRAADAAPARLPTSRVRSGGERGFGRR